MFMRAGKSWGVALFVVMSLTTLFITPAAADDLDAMSQGVCVQLVIVDKAPQITSVLASPSPRNRGQITPRSPKPRSGRLLELICVRLC
jgi:hypothetical protein